MRVRKAESRQKEAQCNPIEGNKDMENTLAEEEEKEGSRQLKSLKNVLSQLLALNYQFNMLCLQSGTLGFPTFMQGGFSEH